MKKLAAAFISFACLSSAAMADMRMNNPRYLCKSDDGVTIARIFPMEKRAHIRKTNGLPSYNMTCIDGVGENWLECEGADARTLVFKRDGLTAVYYGSKKDTIMPCFQAGGF